MNDSNPIEQWRLFAAALLSLVVILVWQAYFVEPPVQELPAIEAGERVVEESLPTGPREAVLPAEAPSADGGVIAAPEAAIDSIDAIEAAMEEVTVVENAEFRAEFTNRGAQLTSFLLPAHFDSEGKALDLVRRRSGDIWDFALVGGPEIEALNRALFETSRESRDGVDWVQFHHRSALGEARKAFGFRSDGLIEVEVTVPGRRDWSLVVGPGIRNPSPEELENRFARRTAVYRTTGESAEIVDSQKASESEVISGVGLSWAGLQDNYFLTALIMESPISDLRFDPILVTRQEEGLFSFDPIPAEVNGDQEDLTRDFQLRLTPGRESWTGLAFMGPKVYEHLSSLPYGLQETIDFGMFGFLSRPLLYGLNWIHDNWIANYGWSIILMTFLIKIVLFPLTHKGYVSMQKMQLVNPKVQAIRQKYRPKLKDKQGRPNTEMQRKMNEEVMALYKTEGVNPAGGCFPLLLQMPVLLAFYRLLSASIEVRGAPWIGWITDLAAPDPFRVLPIVMGASQFIQQRLTPASGDPMQRRIFAMMPIFFTILFMGFPSGLVLYWLTNNVLQIFQQAGYNAWKKRKGES